MGRFKLESEYAPAGDQPKAIQQLVAGFRAGKGRQVLLGATGTGKTFTASHVIQALDSRSGLKQDLDHRDHDWSYWLKLVAVAGVVGVIILILVSGLLPSQKPLLLGIWTAWCLLIVGAAVTLEYLRISLKQSAELLTLDEDDIKHPARNEDNDLAAVAPAETEGEK